MRLDLTPTGNPFDPDVIAVDVMLRHESGDEVALPAFWYRDHTYALSADGKDETFTPVGAAAFVARFAPRRKGRWDWR
ncbi:MAG TPA: DUF5060 domain-containing protein, partial [Planctomycetota bacterium]|nr:DUF5060 domain-containing protein [Planctomycetota bacterium]